jgi:ketosteroid isomerase-like protein
MSTAEAVGTMTTQEIAQRFQELAQQGNWALIQEELFSDDAESIEPTHSPGLQSAKGKDALKQKGEMFNAMVEEMHGGWSSEPVVAGNHFAVAMGMDVTMKGQGRSKMDEIALYEVKDGKIVKEQFFY